MKKSALFLLLFLGLSIPAWAGLAVGWEFQPSLRYAGVWDGGYSGNALRLGYALSLGDVQIIPNFYYMGQSYGGEMGLGLLAHIPGWLPHDLSQGPYAGLDLGAGLFRPSPVFAWAVQAGWQLDWQLGGLWLTLRVGLRYHNAPWYSQNVSPMGSLDVPVSLAVVWGR